MKILITGAKGFIGKNLVSELKNQEYTELYEYDMDSTLDELDRFTKDCEFVFHLAGINRPKDNEEYLKGNFGFTSVLLDSLKKHRNKAPIMLSSSIMCLGNGVDQITIVLLQHSHIILRTICQ